MQSRALLFQQQQPRPSPAARRRAVPMPMPTPTPPPSASAAARRQPQRRAAAAPASSTTTITPQEAEATTARYFGQGDRRPIILYDGVCNLCNGAVDVMLRLDPASPGRFRMAALQSDAGRALLRRSGRAPDDISSIVLVDSDGFYIRSEAVRRIAAGLNALTLLPLLAAAAAPVPLALRDAAYDLVADNRYSFFGRTESCRIGDRSPGREYEERFVTY